MSTSTSVSKISSTNTALLSLYSLKDISTNTALLSFEKNPTELWVVAKPLFSYLRFFQSFKMLSRALLRAVDAGSRQSAALMIARTSSGAVCTPGESGVRDEKNFPRPVRGEPGKVRMGFIPEEWFQFFHSKTGVTGPYMFGFGLSTYLISKEIYVMEHEFYNGLAILVMVIYAHNKFGPVLAKYLDKEVDKEWDEWRQERLDTIKNYEDGIAAEKKEQWRAQGQELLIQAKKENIALQLEANYRERLMTAYIEVKRRLDYQVVKSNLERRIAQKNLVDWVVRNVRAAITPDQEKETLNRCIADLGALAATAK